MRKIIFAIFIIGSISYAQPWYYDFGTGTGSHTSGVSTTFLPSPSTSGGTARVRIGTQGGSFNLENQTISFGSGSYLRGVAPTGGSVNKFSIYDYTPGKSFYTKFTIRLGDVDGGDTATVGTWYFFQGDGAMYSDNNAFTGAQVFTGLRWVFGASGAITFAYRSGSSWVATGISGTPFTQGNTYIVEIHGNNSTSTIDYVKSGAQSVAPNKFDLWVDGVLIGDDLSNAQLAPDVDIDSYMFYSENSSANSANIFIDDIEYANYIYKPTPTNHVTDLEAFLAQPGHSSIDLQWVDATGGVEPDGYLVKGSNVGFGSIVDPTDGVPESDGLLIRNVLQGELGANFILLDENTTYYFKVFPFTNTGSEIKYKTDGSVPQDSKTTLILPSLPLVENFDYTVGQLLTENGWVAYNERGTNSITVTSGSLTYAGYPSSGIGNSVFLTSSGEDVNRNFTAVTSGNVYVSMLVNVSTAVNDPAGDYFFHLGPLSLGSIFRGRIFIKKDGSDNVAFGISKSASTANYTGFDYSLNNTYLIVLKYEIVAGSGNDTVRLWINPDLSGPEPEADLMQADGGTDPTDLGTFALRQGQFATAPTLTIDGIRIGTSWADAPLPVELASFTASVVNGKVKLSWKTETETNNYGFEIQRSNSASTDGSSKPLTWKKIGFVEGAVNSNSPKSYSFTDNNVNFGLYSYRLKQVDTDGKFEYSFIVEADLGTPKEFALNQNYPNPFNPTTTISFTLPEPVDVKITVFNILGQEVATILNQRKEAGVHSVEFDASELNSGLYIYRMDAGKYSNVRKMLLVK